MHKIFWLLLTLAIPGVVQAQFEMLLVPPSAAVPAGRTMRLTLYLNNPTKEPAKFKLPAEMSATLASPSEQRTLPVVSAEEPVNTEIVVAPMDFHRVALTVVLPTTLGGSVSLRLVDFKTNPVMFSITPAEEVRLTPRAQAAAEQAAADKPRDLNQATDFERVRRQLLPYEPIYFVVGFREGLNARFQFSFKFRLLTPPGNMTDVLHDLYFGYTQTSLWDLHDESKPFHDTSYKPTLFYYHELFDWKPAWIDRLGLQMGLQHESNGQAAKTSRSLNTFYVMPIVSWVKWRGWEFSVAPRAITYLNTDENPDLPGYRGYVEWMLSAQHGDDFKFTAHLRKGTAQGYGSVELNASWPFQNLVNGLGGRVQLQYFNGWGESLLDYNKRRDDQIRIGLMLVP